MTATLPPALAAAQKLLADPPADPDISRGYLDLLGAQISDVPENTGPIQALWASTIGSMLYDNAQALARRVSTALHEPTQWLDLPAGGTALDVGCGPGNVTAALGRAVGPDGLAIGVDISEPMLARAAAAAGGPNVGFIRADAQRLPLRDASVAAVTSMLLLQLIPQPATAVAEMVRVLRPGGRIAVLVPTVGPVAGLLRLLPSGGAYVFGDDELADTFEELGLVSVRAKSVGTIQWVRGVKA
ncbi:MAG: methyltransferase domain-containing protein [Actinomycetota bacterium]|nr:methyltransferase domain-containing protein [Actinomycetota bacterium]